MAGHDPPGPEPEVKASGWEGLKRTVKVVASKVKIASKPHVRLRVRKQFDLAVMQLTVGTDLGMSFENESGRAQFSYMPNYTASLRDKYFWGDLGFDRKSASITYSKDFNLDTICVGVDLSYHVPSNCPYVNFNIHTTPGLCSSAKDNGISIDKHFDHLVHYPDVAVDVQGHMDLPKATFDASSSKVETGTFDFNFRKVDITTTW